MDDIASLGFAVDSAPLKQAESSLRAVEAAAQRAGISVEEYHKRTAATTQRFKEQATAASAAASATAAQGASARGAVGGNDQLGNSLSQTRATFRLLARDAGLVGGPLGSVIRDFGTLFLSGQRLSFGLTASVIGFSAVTAATAAAVVKYAEFESHQAKLANAIQATGGASRQTAASIESFVQAQSLSGTQSTSKIRDASAELLKYRAVAGNTFPEVLRLAQDVAATGFADLKSATSGLAKALQDPTDAAKEFESIGLRLSVAQQRLATDLYNSGRAAEAQKVLLKAASDQVGGADAKAADTLSAALGRLGNASQRSLEDLGGAISTFLHLKQAIDAAASALDAYNRLGKEGPAADRRRDVANAFKARTSRELTPLAQAAGLQDIGSPSKLAQSAGIGDIGPSPDTLKRFDEVRDKLMEAARIAKQLPFEAEAFQLQLKAGVLSTEELMKGMLGTSEAAKQITTELANVKGAQALAAAMPALERQLEIAKAHTGQKKLEVIEQQRIKELVEQTGSLEAARTIAGKERQIQQENINASVEQQTKAIRQQTELMRSGFDPVVQAAQAYKNAIDDGASRTQAAALRAAVLANAMLRAEQAAEKMAAALDQASEAEFAAKISALGGTINQVTGTVTTPQGSNVVGKGADSGIYDLKVVAREVSRLFNDYAKNIGNTGPAIPGRYATPQEIANRQIYEAFTLPRQINQGQIDVLNAKGGASNLYDEKTRTQFQLDALKLQNAFEADPFKRQQIQIQIADLTAAMNKNTDAVDANTAATLNPLYSSGHGALAIGYYKAAGGMDMAVRGGTPGVDSVPIHIMAQQGERVRVIPNGSNDNRPSVTTIINVSGEDTPQRRRSARQRAQGFVSSQMAVAG